MRLRLHCFIASPDSLTEINKGTDKTLPKRGVLQHYCFALFDLVSSFATVALDIFLLAYFCQNGFYLRAINAAKPPL